MSPLPKQQSLNGVDNGAIRLREIRLASGLVLGAFLLTHFSNHALGLFSIEAMERGRQAFNLLWRNPLGTALLYGALMLHYVLALTALFRRRTLHMPAREAAQLALGLSIPFLLLSHVTGTRLEFSLTGREVGYPDVLRGLWITAPENGVRQALALIVVWLHGCLGLYFWLRSKSWFPRYATLLYTCALLVPVLALLGFAEAGKEIAADPARFPPTPAMASSADLLTDIRTSLYVFFAASIGVTLAARGFRAYRNRNRRIRITYPGVEVVSIPLGFSVLEGSRIGGIPHQSACGGRGRCSTCRIRIVEGLEAQPAPTAQELATLRRISAGPDIRLACQLRPTHDLSVIPVLSLGPGGMITLLASSRVGRGRERELAVLFCDLRGFTRLTEHRLPFDTVFILNRYFEVVGRAIEDAGGHVDKFIGDGALALFGLTQPPEKATKQAFDAALRILKGVDHLNRVYASELDQPLQVVVSLHAGPAIIGEMGYGQATNLTAVGDTINAASRLESLAKERGAQLVVSAELARRAGLDLTGHERQTVLVRGREAPIDAWIIQDVREITSVG
ncbi:adenylate/guanylate cyclase domain-containing protein [Microvirga sp. 2TAF3]|uniref:adenylate/guanylate cyclase domain-containing protein n=1 Tax=Microvirga sp. 2TAF3 TaxID=3233014 RepID=UPI003F9AB9E3